MNKITVPFNPIFKPVHQCKKRYVVMKGSAGSGKSVDTAQLYILRLMRDKGRNLVCVRKSDITNRDSTFAELESAINRMGVGRAWRVTQSPLSFTCINGNKIIFRGVNDNKQREKLKSITFANGKLTDVWIEEATELVQQDFEIIDDRLRGELPDGLFYQIKLTFNPVSSSHWIKKVFFDIQDDNVLTHQSTYLTNRFCDEAYRQRMLRRKEVDPEGYRIYGLGEWGETGGLIFSNYRIEEFDTDMSRFDAMAIGQDFGFNHANAILTLGYKDGDIYVCNELYAVCLHGIPVNGSRLILIFGNGYALGHSSLKLRSVTAVKALFLHRQRFCRHGRYRRSLQNKKPAECERRQTFSCTVLMK